MIRAILLFATKAKAYDRLSESIKTLEGEINAFRTRKVVAHSIDDLVNSLLNPSNKERPSAEQALALAAELLPVKLQEAEIATYSHAVP